MDVIQRGVISLLGSAITGEKQDLPEGFDLKSAVSIISKQGVLPLAFQGALNCGFSTQDPLMSLLMKQYIRYMIRCEKQMRAVQQLFHAFDENNIAYLPLKGCVIRALYPKPELRTMGDADILIRQEQYDRICPLMESLGYTWARDDEHVSCWKSDSLSVELHRFIVSASDEDYYSYYDTGWKFAQCTYGSRYDYTPEDTFIFLFVHFAKHFRLSGIGCRQVVDFYIFLKSNPELDMTYIFKELEKLHLKTFAENILRLLDVWFDNKETDPMTDFITGYIFSGGNWGSVENAYILQEVKKRKIGRKTVGGQFGILLRIIFPPLSKIRAKYPCLDKYPFLLPLCWVWRWITVLINKPQKILTHTKGINACDAETIDEFQKALEYVGLSYHSK